MKTLRTWLGWIVSNRTSSVSVISAINLGFFWSFNCQSKISWTSVFSFYGEFGWNTNESVFQSWTIAFDLGWIWFVQNIYVEWTSRNFLGTVFDGKFVSSDFLWCPVNGESVVTVISNLGRNITFRW